MANIYGTVLSYLIPIDIGCVERYRRVAIFQGGFQSTNWRFGDVTRRQNMDLQFKMGISLTAMLDFISPKETLKISIQAACFFLKTQSSCKAIRPWDMGTNIWEDDPRTLLVG